jgi:hypothetical protein
MAIKIRLLQNGINNSPTTKISTELHAVERFYSTMTICMQGKIMQQKAKEEKI